jgi:hypothetical protein
MLSNQRITHGSLPGIGRDVMSEQGRGNRPGLPHRVQADLIQELTSLGLGQGSPPEGRPEPQVPRSGLQGKMALGKGGSPVSGPEDRARQARDDRNPGTNRQASIP